MELFHLFPVESSFGGMFAKWKVCKVPAIQSCFYKVSVREYYILNVYDYMYCNDWKCFD